VWVGVEMAQGSSLPWGYPHHVVYERMSARLCGYMIPAVRLPMSIA